MHQFALIHPLPSRRIELPVMLAPRPACAADTGIGFDHDSLGDSKLRECSVRTEGGLHIGVVVLLAIETVLHEQDPF